MDFRPAEQVANAVLYEGYLLYPYRPSALKNRHRWTFGCLFSPDYCRAQGGTEASGTRTECLVLADAHASLAVKVRFLHLRSGPPLTLPSPPGGEGRVRGDGTWQDAVEREVVAGPHSLEALAGRAHRHPFAFAAEAGAAWDQRAIEGEVELSAECLGDGVFRVSSCVANVTSLAEVPAGRDAGLLTALVSCHSILGVEDGEFVPLLDPPETLREAAARCRNVGTWPVPASGPGRRDLLLSSPIILPDHPRVAAESPGDLFDATEIDELLTLRIMTLTEEEKREVRAADGRARALLERTEALAADQLRGLHGARSDSSLGLRPGVRVRLRPRGRTDVFDLALAGRTAVIASVEQDLEDGVHLNVVLDDDPGRDLGLEGKPGHRFFFHPDEVEILGEQRPTDSAP